MRNVAIIQARVGSSRLPRKILLDLSGKTVLERVFERVKKSVLVDKVVIATTIGQDDLEVVNLCANRDMPVYCGSENDVLDRYYQAARLFGADNIIRVTSDCPLIDYRIIDEVVQLHLAKKTDYTSNVLEETFPDGEDVEVFTFSALEEAWKSAKLISEREHVTPYIKKNTNIFKLNSLKNHENISNKRWTIDEARDYEFIKTIYDHLFKINPLFGMDDILELLKENPQLEEINSGIARNEGYLKSLREDKTFLK